MADYLKEIKCKLLILGAGPGGYVCAIKAGQLGLDTVIVEKGCVGGTCLNVGCIPSKALIHAADEFHKISKTVGEGTQIGITTTAPKLDFAKTIGWKDGIVGRLNSGVSGLLKRAKVRAIEGQATFLDGKRVEVMTQDGPQLIQAETIVIATGSAPVELPFLKFGGNVICSTQALALSDVPNKLVIVGGGYIGLELGTAFAKLGAKVTVVEGGLRVLPQYDADLTKPVVLQLAKLGVEVLTKTKAKGLSSDGKSLLVVDESGAEKSLYGDKILVTVGRKPVTTGWGMDKLVLNLNGNFIQIDDQCRTSMRDIYAIGDVTGEQMLAHRAMAQGEMVAEIVGGLKRKWDKYCIPAVCFTDAEVVTVGLSPQDAKSQNIQTKIGQLPVQANGRAMTIERDDGFIRVVARADTHIVIGFQAVGAGISELSAGFALAIEMGARLEDIASTIHAHPTLSEGLQEAALSALGHAIHI